ncbi:MAG: hypothetical protein JW804_01340, partial [Sedimentisphaerales bacterium]|nr:hypothetical protein [Sedimentisphaerales bacterium]
MELAVEYLTFWMSGEIEGDVYDDYDLTENTIENNIKNFINNKNYGTGIKLWSFLTILLEPNTDPYYPEIKRYSRKNKQVEFRLKIDYKKFRDGNDKSRLKLLAESVLRSVKLMREMKIKDFDIDRLEADVT